MRAYLVPLEKIVKIFAVLGLLVGLSGCGGGGGSDANAGAVNSEVRNSGSGSTVATGSTTLTWSAPVARADGAALTPSAIGGFRIYYGTSAGNYPYQLDVTDSTVTSYTVSDVPVGTYYFVMTAYDTAGRESGYSSVTTKAVN